MDNNDFNKEVKELRNKKGLSQEELANLTGLSLRTIQRIENGETNPHGDTKRKIIKILESYPDMGFSNKGESSIKKSFFQKVVEKWEYVFIIYIFSILGVLIGFIGFNMFFIISFPIGFLCVILLSVSTAYLIKINGWRSSRKIFIASLSALIIYLFIISFMLPVKEISVQTKEGVTTKIERNLITGESDTTKTINCNQ